MLWYHVEVNTLKNKEENEREKNRSEGDKILKEYVDVGMCNPPLVLYSN